MEAGAVPEVEPKPGVIPMRNRRAEWAWASLAMIAAAMAVGLAWAQDLAPKAKTITPRKGRNHTGPKTKIPRNAADPLTTPPAVPKDIKSAPAGTFHYMFKVTAFDGTPLAASYYPARLNTSAPVVLMIHEKERSSKDFEEPIGELKGQGLAEHMQANGYAVLLFDLRGHGANQRRAPTPKEWRQMPEDIQAAYQFLVDRNNRGELNLAKLAVIGVGEGANLAAAWTARGGGVSNEGRGSDLGALVLISPLNDVEKIFLRDVVPPLAARVPMLLLAGARDSTSGDPVKTVKIVVERARLNKVELFDTSLHGYKMLRLEPKATAVISRVLEGTVKFKAVEWEPRYNLTPVNIDNIQVVRNAKPLDAAKTKEAAPAQE